MERHDPPDSILDSQWAITWVPNPVNYRSYDPVDQYRTCLTYLKHANNCMKLFTFVPELTRDGNVHIHGVYYVKDCIKYFRKFLPMLKKQGFVKIKPVDDYGGWIAYMMKDMESNDELFDDLPYPYHQDSKFKQKIKPQYTLSKPILWKKQDIAKYFK